MHDGAIIRILGLIGAAVMPLWNIPLIIRIGRRRSSKDLGLSWTLGIFACILLMLPAGLISPDPILKIFSVANTVLFGGVVIQVVRYR